MQCHIFIVQLLQCHTCTLLPYRMDSLLLPLLFCVRRCPLVQRNFLTYLYVASTIHVLSLVERCSAYSLWGVAVELCVSEITIVFVKTHSRHYMHLCYVLVVSHPLLHTHTHLQFIPSAQSESQYMASTGMDGFTMFWKFNASTREFRCVRNCQ